MENVDDDECSLLLLLVTVEQHLYVVVCCKSEVVHYIIMKSKGILSASYPSPHHFPEQESQIELETKIH